MIKIFNKIKEKIKSKQDLPPPYRENEEVLSNEEHAHSRNFDHQIEALDLLANCNINHIDSETDVEYAEISEDMGIWHSTPLTKRHRSKISLTWVLKENLENTKLKSEQKDFSNYEQHISLINNQRRAKSKDRVVGRSEHYHLRNDKKQYQSEHLNYQSDKQGYQSDNLRYQSDKLKYQSEHKLSDRRSKSSYRKRSGSEHRYVVTNNHNEDYHSLKIQSGYDNVDQSLSDDTSVQDLRKRQKHRHRKKKRRPNGKFGYDIRDLDCFLSEASLDRPGNIPVVIAYPTTLYQTHNGYQRELPLPLGTVVNAVFKSEQWVYAQTPHGEEGYVVYPACMPLGILPNRTPQKKTPCWESSTDIYPRPCGNLTDNEKEQLRGRTKSECQYRPIRDKRRGNAKSYAEENFDSLYLKTKSYQNIDKLYDEVKLKSSLKKPEVRRQILLVVNQDFRGSEYDRTLTVKQGDVVVLVERRENDDWFYVKKRDGNEGFIPAIVAGNGYI